MCHATLHVSTLSCHHRYYKLVSPCSSRLDLSTCPNRVTLDGWEQREADCPFCGASRLESPGDVPFSPTSADSESTSSRRGSATSTSRRASATTQSSTYSYPGYDSRIYRILSGPPVEDQVARSPVLPGSRSQLRRHSSSARIAALMPDIRSGSTRVIGEEQGGMIVRIQSNKFVTEEKPLEEQAEEIVGPEEAESPRKWEKRMSWVNGGGSGIGRRGSVMGSIRKKGASLGLLKT